MAPYLLTSQAATGKDNPMNISKTELMMIASDAVEGTDVAMAVKSSEHAFTVCVNTVNDFSAGSGAMFVTVDPSDGMVVSAGTMTEFRPTPYRGPLDTTEQVSTFLRGAVVALVTPADR